VNVDERRYDRDMQKMYDMIELIYILNRLSNNSYVDERSKQYLIQMLGDVESIKSNFDKYRVRDFGRESGQISYNKSDDYNYNHRGGFFDKIIFFLKSLNNGE